MKHFDLLCCYPSIVLSCGRLLGGVVDGKFTIILPRPMTGKEVRRLLEPYFWRGCHLLHFDDENE